MNLFLTGAIIVVGVVLFVFYGMKREEEKNEKRVAKHRLSRNLINDYYLDIIEYVTTQFYEKAGVTLRELIDKNPDEYPAYLILSYILRKQGKADKALQVDKTIFANKTALSRRGLKAIEKSLLIDYMENGMYKTALKTIEEDEKEFAGDEFIYALGRDIAYKLGQFEKALYYADRLLDMRKIKDKSELGYIAADMAEGALFRHEFDGAARLIKEGKKYNKGCERLYYLEGYYYYLKGDKEKGRHLFIKALEMKPGTIFHVKDYLREIFEEDDTAIEAAVAPVLKKHAENAPLHVFYSMILKNLGRYSEAIEELLEAILYQPDSRYILFLMLDLYIENENWEKVKEIRDELRGLETKRSFFCTQCGAETDKMTWHCDSCGKWGEITVHL
jgi:lipopolysaccharide biosynthesis regulator YciM